MTYHIANDVIKHVPGFQYWALGEERKMSSGDTNQCGRQQRAWDFYWAIRQGTQHGGICLGIGSGSIRAPSTLMTDKFNGTSPNSERYPSPNGNSTMHLDVDKIPWPFFDKQFCAVISNHSFEHFNRQPEVLREAFRVLRPGGCVCLLQPDMTFCGKGNVDPTHTREHYGDGFLSWITEELDLPEFEIVCHNTLDNSFSFDTVLRKPKGD